MNCYKCATPIPEDSRFCSACGADVSGDSHAHAQGATLTVDQDHELFAKLQAELGSEYILERELGRGGMAVVFLGRDAHLNRKVAVKVLPPELTYGGRGSMIERFKREAQTAAKLDHPNIIPVYRVAPGGKLFWYVMKYLDGEPLDDILEREGQLSVERTVDIVTQVAAALGHAHENQVVHRDVKPANVVIDKKGAVTVTDFGIAKALDANTLTASGSIIGTPYYMSPEQCKGKRVGPAADQYSLAVMTYQMLGGHVPFTGDSAVEIVHKHVADPVPPLGVLRPNLPEKMVAVVERGLAKTPEERFPTVAEFVRVLKAAAEGLDVTVAPPVKTGAVRISKTALVSPVPGALRTAKSTWRERKALILSGAGTAVVAVAVTVALLLRGGEAPAGRQLRDDSIANLQLAGRSPAQTPAAPAPAVSTLAAPPTEPVATPAQPRRTARERRALALAEAAPKPQRPSEQRVVAAPPPSAKAEPAQPPVQAVPTQPQLEPPRPAVGFITVGTQPRSTIWVNGTPAQKYPLVNFQVPAGQVRLRFQVTESTGVWWAPDSVITVAAGATVRLGFIRLVRP